MKKKSKTRLKSNQKNGFSKQTIMLFVLSVWMTLLTIVTLLGGVFIYQMWNMQLMDGNSTIKQLITQGIDNYSRIAPVDARTGMVYIPEKQLVLPTMQEIFGPALRYQYYPVYQDQSDELRITNGFGVMDAKSRIISALSSEEVFNQVPELQACSRGYLLSFSETKDAGVFKFTKTLADGRQLYVYLDAGCKQINQDFESYLKKVDSY